MCALWLEVFILLDSVIENNAPLLNNGDGEPLKILDVSIQASKQPTGFVPGPFRDVTGSCGPHLNKKTTHVAAFRIKQIYKMDLITVKK